MLEQNLEAKLIALESVILEREALFSASILKHKEFGKVKAIYMKTKLLKISYALLLKKFKQEKKSRQIMDPHEVAQSQTDGMTKVV